MVIDELKSSMISETKSIGKDVLVFMSNHWGFFLGILIGLIVGVVFL